MSHRFIGLIVTVLGVFCLGGEARAAEVRVLSAAAVSPGLEAAVALYRNTSGQAVTIAYATGPEIQARVGGGEGGFDVVVAPAAVLAALAEGGQLPAKPLPLGKVGIAAAVRPGAPKPDLSSPEALMRSLLAAKTVVISRGSTGVYLEGLFARLGIEQQLEGRLERAQNGAAVVERILGGQGAEIGLSAQTELTLGHDRGLILVGPLPATIQNDTLYSAAAFPAALSRSEVASLMRFLATPQTRAVMEKNGVD
jgi:molybdate transport system substrate-binding protein